MQVAKNIFVHITWFYLDRPDPILSEITRPGSYLHFCLPTQHRKVYVFRFFIAATGYFTSACKVSSSKMDATNQPPLLTARKNSTSQPHAFLIHSAVLLSTVATVSFLISLTIILLLFLLRRRLRRQRIHALYFKSTKAATSKAWFTYISQTKSCDFVVPARSCDPRCAARRRLATLFIYFFNRPFKNPSINVTNKMCGC